MKKSFMLLATVLFSFFLALTMSVSLLRSNIQLRDTRIRTDSSYAFYAAETGIEAALFQLRSDINWRDGLGSPDAPVTLRWDEGETNEAVGSYYVNVANGGVVSGFNTVWLRSVGINHPAAGEQPITRVVIAQVGLADPAAFFTSTLGDITLARNANIQGDILGRDINFQSGGTNITVDGNVSYIRNISDYSQADISGDVQPIPPITFTSIDINRYENLAQTGGRYVNGNLTITGTIDRDSLEANNGVVYATGNIYIDATVAESMLIVAGGNIYINGDIEMSDENVQIGLFAKNDVIIPAAAPSNISVDAFIMADGGDNGNGVFKAEGGIGSKEALNFEGAISVRGRNVSTAINLNAYANRSYTYDQELVNNRNIPFVPFIATIIEWREILGGNPVSQTFPPAS